MQITQGSIVIASLLDPQGRNRKVRPAVVLTATAKITDDAPFLAVAITGNLSRAWDEVLLPWNSQGRGRTKLTKPCVAKCSWLVRLMKTEIVEVRGHVPNAPLNKIIQIVNETDTES